MHSQNGYPLSPARSRRTVPGTNVKLEVADGLAGSVLVFVAQEFHKRVEPLRQADSAGYSYRKISGTSVWSNHASATAIDLNWNSHGYGRRGTFSTAQVKEIRKILAETGGAVRWGGDWRTPDPMHFEVAVPVGQAFPTIRKGSTGGYVIHAQACLNTKADAALTVDGEFGTNTHNAVVSFQHTQQLAPDGIIGPRTWSRLLDH